MFFHLLHYVFLFLAMAVYVTVGGAVSGILRRRGASEETYLSSGIFWPIGIPALSLLWLANRSHVVVMTFPEHTTYQNRMLETKLDQQERIVEKASTAAEHLSKLVERGLPDRDDPVAVKDYHAWLDKTEQILDRNGNAL